MEGDNTQPMRDLNDGIGAAESKGLSLLLPFHNMETTTMSETTTTDVTRDSLIEMFLDGTPNEVYGNGRLLTRRVGEGRVSLIAYGWNKIAEYDENSDTVTIHAGHHGNISQTVDRYIDLVREMGGKRETRTISTLIESAPNVGRPPAESVQFIENYYSFSSGRKSSVENWATKTVNRALEQTL